MRLEPVTTVLDLRRILGFARNSLQAPANAQLTLAPLRGGLEASGTAKAVVSWAFDSGRRSSISFVVKPVSGPGRRELDVYRAMQHTDASDALPRLLGWDEFGSGESYMYIEWVRSIERWPWHNTEYSQSVVERLAAVHSLPTEPLRAAIPNWDYETELLKSAQETIRVFGQAAQAGTIPGSRPMLRALERVVTTLPAMRVALHSAYPTTFLHGDVHAGNAVVQRAGGKPASILLDWGRARFGSPLEDVSSWLQSLGYWEFEVRRRHDTLFRHYLEASNLPDRLSPELRNLYWVAASSNAMAGALRYHSAVMNDPERTMHQRSAAAGAVADWLRIIRRADACWRN